MPGVDADPFGHDEVDGAEGEDAHAAHHGEHDELAG